MRSAPDIWLFNYSSALLLIALDLLPFVFFSYCTLLLTQVITDSPKCTSKSKLVFRMELHDFIVNNSLVTFKTILCALAFFPLRMWLCYLESWKIFSLSCFVFVLRSVLSPSALTFLYLPSLSFTCIPFYLTQAFDFMWYIQRAG